MAFASVAVDQPEFIDRDTDQSDHYYRIQLHETRQRRTRRSLPELEARIGYGRDRSKTFFAYWDGGASSPGIWAAELGCD